MNTLKRTDTLIATTAILLAAGTALSRGARAQATDTDIFEGGVETNDTGDAADTAPAGRAEAAPAGVAADSDAPEPSDGDAGDDGAAGEDETGEAEEGLAGEAKRFFDAIGVRTLGAESFRSQRTLGIKGGSLSQISHGLQWPYMRESGIGLSGYLWIDTGYEKIDRSEDPNQPDTKLLLQEGRFVLRVTPTFSRGRWFVQAQAELVANKDQASTQPAVVDADDVWGKVGVWDLFDIQVGRFEAWELYHFGMGMDLNTMERRGATESGNSSLSVPQIYGTTFAFYRPNGAGNVAAHIYPTDFLRVELLGQLGNQGSLNTATFRGAGILDFGWVKLKGGGEYVKQKSTTGGYDERDDRGAGGTVQFIINPYLEFGGSGGWAITDRIDTKDVVDEKGSFITWSAGGFANARIIDDLLIGGGINYTHLKDTHEDGTGKVGEFSHLQTFGALQYLLFDRLYIKAVVAWAKGDLEPSFSESLPHANKMISGRLRFQYNF